MRKISRDLRDFLEVKYHLYNQSYFIYNDPIVIPHSFTHKEDIEIAGFLVATIAWGQRSTILKNGFRLIELMGNSPYDFILNFKSKDLRNFDTFVHRTFNSIDCKYFLKALQHIYKKKGGLNKLFYDSLNVHNGDVGYAISTFRKTFFSLNYPERTLKHISDPIKNSSAKRMCMFLRWMVRRDKNVDFGIWTNISPKVLAIPLDVHSGRVSRSLGLLERKQNDWKAVMELTSNLRKFDPFDPVKYDFALFGLGINEKFH